MVHECLRQLTLDCGHLFQNLWLYDKIYHFENFILHQIDYNEAPAKAEGTPCFSQTEFKAPKYTHGIVNVICCTLMKKHWQLQVSADAGVSLCPVPDGNLDYKDILKSTEKVFLKVILLLFLLLCISDERRSHSVLIKL